MNIIITMIIIISSSSISIIISSIGIIILIDTYTYIYICYYYYYYSIRVHRPSPTTDASLQGRPTAMAGGVVLCSGCVAAATNWERSCAIVTHGTTANLRPNTRLVVTECTGKHKRTMGAAFQESFSGWKRKAEQRRTRGQR